MLSEKVIRDPVHGYIHLNNLEANIINTKIFLRLQHIKQSPTAYLTYPSHYVNRFVHSLGVMELSGKIAFYVLENSPTTVVNKFLNKCKNDFAIDRENIKEVFIQTAKLAGLLHDLGHPPFSHQGESALSKDDILKLYNDDSDFPSFVTAKGGKLPKFHEFSTHCLIRDNEELHQLLTTGFNYKSLLLKIFGPCPEGAFSTIHKIISSDMDADRADFLLRDGMTSGIGFGQYDIMRLIESMVLYEDKNEHFHIVPTTSALSTIESFLVERYKMYKWLYYHPHVVLTDTALSYLLRKVLEWSKTAGHPLENVLKLEDFHYKNYIYNELPFDDTVIIQKLKQAFGACKELYGQDNEWQDDIDLTYILLRIVLFREKFAKAVFKNISEYRSFDLDLKQEMISSSVPYSELFPDEPLLNNYAKRTAGTVPLPEDCRFDKILTNENQFVLETERSSFEPFSFERYERRMPISREEAVTKKEYRSKFFLVDKKSGKQLFISELSQTVKQLLEAWHNDMQLFLYIVRLKKPKSEEWSNIIEENRNKMKEHINSLWSKDLLRYKPES